MEPLEGDTQWLGDAGWFRPAGRHVGSRWLLAGHHHDAAVVPDHLVEFPRLSLRFNPQLGSERTDAELELAKSRGSIASHAEQPHHPEVCPFVRRVLSHDGAAVQERLLPICTSFCIRDQLVEQLEIQDAAVVLWIEA